MNPPSIQEQIAVLEDQIRSLRDSHAGPDGKIDDAKAARDIQCMEATVAILRKAS